MSDDDPASGDQPAPARQVDWLAVAFFITVACLISWPLFYLRDVVPGGWRGRPAPMWLLSLIAGWGPGVAGALALVLFRRRHVRRITWWGTSRWLSVGVLLLPVAIVSGVGVPNAVLGLHTAGTLAGIHALLYAAGEELGWRGFLQDALAPLAPAVRYVLIGALWALWHFTTFAGHGSPVEAALRIGASFAVLTLASAALGYVTERTRSGAIATSCHAWYVLAKVLPPEARLPAIGALAVATVFVVHFWHVGSRVPHQPTRRRAWSRRHRSAPEL